MREKRKHRSLRPLADDHRQAVRELLDRGALFERCQILAKGERVKDETNNSCWNQTGLHHSASTKWHTPEKSKLRGGEGDCQTRVKADSGAVEVRPTDCFALFADLARTSGFKIFDRKSSQRKAATSAKGEGAVWFRTTTFQPYRPSSRVRPFAVSRWGSVASCIRWSASESPLAGRARSPVPTSGLQVSGSVMR